MGETLFKISFMGGISSDVCSEIGIYCSADARIVKFCMQQV